MEAKRRKLNHKSETKWQNGSHASSIITVELDTMSPISSIQQIIGKRLRSKELVNHEIFLQDIQLEPALSLYEQGVKVNGKVELSVQVETQGGGGKLTIVEIAKNMTDVEMQILIDQPDVEIKGSTSETENERLDAECKDSDSEKEELGIPCDPALWTSDQVYRWMVWVAREFSLDISVIKNLGMTGQRLSAMTIEEFFAKIPYGHILWSHLSLLKKISNAESVEDNSEESPLNLVTNVEQPKTSSPASSATVKQPISKVVRSPKKIFNNEKSLTGCRGGNNGQIQLWQFLLELLTDADERHLITWIGHEGEFKLIQPEKVARKWGERKNKPAMNYEKLSRALRYYYDGDMISKVQGKRFVYKFVCNLKELLGYDAGELNELVTECENRRRQKPKVAGKSNRPMSNFVGRNDDITMHSVST